MGIYKYGMRLLGFSPGAQPMDCFKEREDDPTGKYHDILVHTRKLDNQETSQYELDYLGEPEQILKRCPFCGGFPEMNHIPAWEQNIDTWWVSCKDCNAETAGETSESEAAYAWNRRETE